jgi:hypothetical protein
LPMFVENKPKVELSLSGIELQEVQKYFEMFVNELEQKNIHYTIRG